MRLGRWPHALVIGAPKAGTTSLCASLARHPEIYMYPKKETHFFNDYYQRRGVEWYQHLFHRAPQDAVIMEGTPDYAMSNCAEMVLSRMSHHLPKAKLIYILRNPVERAISHYVQMLSNHRIMMPFDDAIKRWPEVIETGQYHKILNLIKSYYPADQIAVFLSDDYRKAPDLVHQRILSFLELRDTGQDMLQKLRLDEPLHKREDQGVDGAFLAYLRRSKYYDQLNVLTPRPVINLLKPVFRSPLKAPNVPDEVRAHLIAYFEEEWEACQMTYGLFNK